MSTVVQLANARPREQVRNCLCAAAKTVALQHQLRQLSSSAASREAGHVDCGPALNAECGAQPVGAAPPKALYEIGEIPPLGHVPEKMYAWAIRKERHGPPETSFQVEVLPTWEIADDEVLVLVMAAGVNYNGVWAGLGTPVSPIDGHKNPYHIAGSDASGIVWAIGAKVRRWKVGDDVIVHCNQDDGDDDECNGGDPLLSPSQRIWGYETPDGSFAQFCRVQSRQLMPKPDASHLGRVGLLHADAGDRLPHAVRPRAAYAQARRQRADLGRRRAGSACSACSWSRPRARMRSRSCRTRRKAEYVFNLGAKGVIYRKEFKCWGQMPDGRTRPNTTSGSRRRAISARRSGRSPASATSTSCSSIRASRPSRSRAWW